MGFVNRVRDLLQCSIYEGVVSPKESIEEENPRWMVVEKDRKEVGK